MSQASASCGSMAAASAKAPSAAAKFRSANAVPAMAICDSGKSALAKSEAWYSPITARTRGPVPGGNCAAGTSRRPRATSILTKRTGSDRRGRSRCARRGPNAPRCSETAAARTSASASPSSGATASARSGDGADRRRSRAVARTIAGKSPSSASAIRPARVPSSTADRAAAKTSAKCGVPPRPAGYQASTCPAAQAASLSW